MTWTCEQTEARLSDYLDGLLTPDERHEFDMHANTCEDCAQFVAVVAGLTCGDRVANAARLGGRLLSRRTETRRRSMMALCSRERERPSRARSTNVVSPNGFIGPD